MQAIRYGEALNYLFEFCLSTGKEFPKDWRKIDKRFFNGIKDNKLKDEVKMCVEVISNHSTSKNGKIIPKSKRERKINRVFRLQKIIEHDINFHYGRHTKSILESEGLRLSNMYSALGNHDDYLAQRENGKRIFLIDREMIIHKTFDDVHVASKEYGVQPYNIYDWCNRGAYRFDGKRMIKAHVYSNLICKNKEFHYQF